MIYTLLIISYLVVARGAFLAVGKASRKIGVWESFLFYQKVSAVLFIALALISYFYDVRIILYLSLVNLLLVGLFYIQPTPRTTKSIAVFFIVINILTLLWRFI